jgi:nicotinamide mononucleotide transporter
VTFVLDNWLEITGLISGLLCVWLLVKEHVLTFPIGMLYALVTVVVVARAFLYADVLLNLYYVIMNAYGWYYWVYGGKHLRRGAGDLPPQRISHRDIAVLLLITLLGSLLMGYLFDRHTQADLAYLDSLTTVASFVAMWMSARKYLSSWVAWFFIDLVQIGLYIMKAVNGLPGLFFYAGLYGIYLVMAVWGWLNWRNRLSES